MAGRIRDEDLQVVRERTDLVKLVSGYLTLKKAGHDSMVGVCPFHAEKTPSFSVSPSKQVYYCFGCGAGGDAIRFLREVEKLDFTEAVERLARDAGVTLRYEGDTPEARRQAGKRTGLHRATEEAAGLFRRMLLEGKEAEEARAYLQKRGIGREWVEVFDIGYAPRYPDFLLRRLSKSFGPETLVDAGLALRDPGGGIRDRFRGRITFPIRDLAGKHVGFGARILPGEREEQGPKYLNSPETAIYRKNELLYNLDRAKKPISAAGEAFVVEGYTDVILLAAAGVDNVVATCGTALGEGHFRLLDRFAQRAVLTFDGDEAGARAAERAFEFHERFAVQPVVLILPEGLDPADFAQQKGAEAFRQLSAEARPLVDYMIRRTVGRHDLSTVEGQSAAVAGALPVLEGLQQPVRQREYVHLLAELAGVSEASVLLTLERAMAGKPVEVSHAVKRASAQERLEREMLKLLARDAGIYAALEPKLSGEHFQISQLRSAFRTLVEAAGDVRAIVASGADGGGEGAADDVARLLSALTLEQLDGEQTAEYAQEVWSGLQAFVLRRRSAELRQRLQKMNPQTDEGYDELFQQLVTLDGDLRRLKEHRQVHA